MKVLSNGLASHQPGVNLKQKLFFYALCVGVFLWFSMYFFKGERIFFRDGLGFDGSHYAALLSYFENGTWKLGFTQYLSGRWFPSFVNFLVMKMLNIPILGNYQYEIGNELVKVSSQNIFAIFYVYNVFMVSMCILLLYKIFKLRQWSFSVLLIGFSGLFVNFSILKFAVYYPVLTDFTAFFLGMLMLYFYLKDNLIGLLIVACVGAFTFPTMEYCACILLLFLKDTSLSSRKHIVIPPVSSLTSFFSAKKLSVIFAFILVVCAISVGNFYGFRNSNLVMTILSLFALFVYGYYMIYPFTNVRCNLNISGRRILLVVGYFFLIKYARSIMATGTLNATTMKVYLSHILLQSYHYPFVSLISHAYFFSPVILLITLHWKEMVKCSEKNSGLMLFVLMYAIMAIGSESRQFINAVPIFIFLLCEVFNERKISIKFSYVLLGMCLIFSKSWFPINKYLESTFFQAGHPHPWQSYFMHFGPCISTRMYFVALFIIVPVFLGFWWYKKKY